MSNLKGTEPTDLNFDLGIDNPVSHLEQIHQYTVGDLLRKNARIRAEETALVGENGRRVTYGDLNERVNRLANALLDRGLGYGSSVAIVMENRPEFVETLFAGAKIGALVPTQNWRLSRRELLHCLELTDPDMVIVSGTHEEKSEWVEDSDDISTELVSLEDSSVGTDYEAIVASGDPAEPDSERDPSPEDGIAVLYTSGTTGLPKGAVVSNRALINRGLLWGKLASLGPDYVGWNPMFHMGGMEPLLTVMTEGGTYYTIDGFQVEKILDRQEESNAQFLAMFPSTVDPFFDYAETHEWDADAYGVEMMGAMADLYSPTKLRRITELFEADFLNSFGATETGLAPATGNNVGVGSEPNKEDLAKVESPLCEVKLVDADWNEVPQGEVGEVALKGPTLFSGYINNREANTEEFKNGWFRLGDLFTRDEDGQLHYADRRKYLIKSGGENIYPAEIERVLLDHPEITVACVVRVPDDKWSEVPMVYASTVEDSSLASEDVIDFLEGEIARYKLPHYVEFVSEDAFPRSTSGKVQRQPLEERGVTDETERVRSPSGG